MSEKHMFSALKIMLGRGVDVTHPFLLGFSFERTYIDAKRERKYGSVGQERTGGVCLVAL